jgi:hypothetical protein
MQKAPKNFKTPTSLNHSPISKYNTTISQQCLLRNFILFTVKLLANNLGAFE